MNIQWLLNRAILASLLISNIFATSPCLVNCAEPCERACSFNVELHGGVVPIIWAGRGSDCTNQGDRLPSFHDLFKIPFIVGGKVGWNWNECSEIFVQVDYVQAHGRCGSFSINCPSSVNGNAVIASGVGKYTAIGFWVGSRYYFNLDCVCRALSFFAGLQVGFVQHRQIDISLSATSNVGTAPVSCHPMFLRTTTISGGANFGLDLCLTPCLSLVLTGAVLGNGAIRNYPVICLETPLPGINSATVLVGRFQTELWFPLTLGLKFTY